MGVSPNRLAVPVLLATLLAATPFAAAHSGESGRGGLSERQLRSFETSVLGAGHAKEHAQGRERLKRRRGARRRCLTRRKRARRTLHRLRRTDAAVSRRSLRRLRAQARGGCGKRRKPSRPRARAASLLPSTDGDWGDAFRIPVLGIHAALLPTGKILWFAYPSGDKSKNEATAWLFDPVTRNTQRVDPPYFRDPEDGQLKPANIWCSGQTLLPDGRVLVAGGNLAYSNPTRDGMGLNKLYTFNPWDETWTEQPDMRRGRWYPTVSTLPDGRVVILSGLDESGKRDYNINLDIEIFTPSPDLNGRGTVTLLGEMGGEGRPPVAGLYPHLFTLRSGRLLVAGPTSAAWFLRPPGHNVFAWEDSADMSTDRYWATAVLSPNGGGSQVMEIGGVPSPIPATSDTLASTERYDENVPSVGWSSGSPLKVPRAHHNTVLLPDGSMVTVGGGVGQRNNFQYSGEPLQRNVELWNPANGTWRLGAAQGELRTYHSTALLLPDGRVISAGDDFNGGAASDTAEIYSPPYLFKGARPRVWSAPSSLTYGQQFDINTPDAAGARVVLVAPGATTHATDMNQRYVPLATTQVTGGLRATVPNDLDLAPPGYYMLFVVRDGVPSIGKFVRLD